MVADKEGTGAMRGCEVDMVGVSVVGEIEGGGEVGLPGGWCGGGFTAGSGGAGAS